MHIYQAPPQPRQLEPSIPIPVEMLILAMLAKEPARRPSMLEVMQQLEMLGAKTTGMMPIVRAPSANQSYQSITPVPSEVSGPNQSSRPSLAGVGQAQDPTRLHLGHRLKRLAIPAAMATVLSAAGIAVVVRTSGGTDEGRPLIVKSTVQPPRKKITWKLESKPTGVEVVRVSDGRVLGSTPLKHEQDAQPGKTGLTLRHPGYYDQQVLLDNEQDGSETISLDPLPGSGTDKATTAPASTPKGSKRTGKKNKQPEAPKDEDELAPVR